MTLAGTKQRVYSDEELREFSEKIEQIISNRELSIVFQPVVCLADRSVFAYEALARNTSSIFVYPPDMLEAAVAVGRCGELGRLLRQIALEGCPDHTLFLNIHPDEFEDGLLIEPDDPIFLHAERVYLEITESVPMRYPELCRSILREIRSHGIRLAVDDLGSGYSNLKYISDLQPEIVKLDRELISGLAKGTRLHRLVTSIVDLSVNMGAQVVAEGIETVEELGAVMDTGAHFGQGYLLARPTFPPPEPSWPEVV